MQKKNSGTGRSPLPEMGVVAHRRPDVTSKLSCPSIDRGQMVLPKDVREKAGIKPGTSLP